MFQKHYSLSSQLMASSHKAYFPPV